MKLGGYWLLIEILLRFRYILVPNFKGLYSVIFKLSILAMNKVYVGKLPILKLAILAILFQHYFKGSNIWWLFAQLYKNSTDCFVLKVFIVSRFQNGICIRFFQKKSKQGSWGHAFLKKTPGIFKFVTLPWNFTFQFH